MNNKSLIEQQELVRYPRTSSEDYSDLHCTICYKRVGEDAWMLNDDNLPSSIKVVAGGVHVLPFQEWTMNKQEFSKWFNEVASFEQSARDIGDCQGSTLLEKIQDWFKYHSAEIKLEASCN